MRTVYLFGAGLNQSLRNRAGLPPPLSGDFFRHVVSPTSRAAKAHREILDPVLAYLSEFWKVTEPDLAIGAAKVDMEEFYTLVQLQLDELEGHPENDPSVQRLLRVAYSFVVLLAQSFTSHDFLAMPPNPLLSLAQVLRREQPAVLSFNYDTLLEDAIEMVSNVRIDNQATYTFEGDIPDAELSTSHFNWNRALGYGIRFDRVQLPRAGPPTLCGGERFFAHPGNDLYPWSILKLHGSLNWYHRLQFRRYPNPFPEVRPDPRETILMHPVWQGAALPDLDGWYVEPLIITPDLRKARWYRMPLFRKLWGMARDALSLCDRLIVVGYSFAPTDFEVRRLFLESFSDHPLRELVVVNPDGSVLDTCRRLTHFDRGIVSCRNLGELMAMLPSQVE